MILLLGRLACRLGLLLGRLAALAYLVRASAELSAEVDSSAEVALAMDSRSFSLRERVFLHISSSSYSPTLGAMEAICSASKLAISLRLLGVCLRAF